MNIKKWLGMRELSEEIENAMVKAACADNKSTKTEEEWIWVDGYKGTDADMKCVGFQYKLHETYNMPEDTEIIECRSGFHLCRDLIDVFNYYSLHDGNRFFKVKALVKKKDYEEYGKRTEYNGLFGFTTSRRTKLVSKSIIILSELTTDEIFECKGFDEFKDWSPEDKELARLKGMGFVAEEICVRELVSLGYSRAFAEYLNKDSKFEIAKAVGSQEDLSMDMKVAYIMRGER